jgi:hypothetical protein
MCSVDPSDSVTVPVPDHDPSKPANGADWAWPADTDNISATPIPAALIACPNKLEPKSFISDFPIQIDDLVQDTSRRIEGLVSPQCVRFKSQIVRCLRPGACSYRLGKPATAKCEKDQS